MVKRRALVRNLDAIERDLAIAQDEITTLRITVRDRDLSIREAIATVQGLLRDHGLDCQCGHSKQAREFLRVVGAEIPK